MNENDEMHVGWTDPIEDSIGWLNAKGYSAVVVAAGFGPGAMLYARPNEPVRMVMVGQTLIWDGIGVQVKVY